jgi:cysteinyl-tRNA synthetase
MSLRLYSTLSRQTEPFETLEPGVVTMYVCGPTVYDRAHVGHAMSALVFDVLRRYLEHGGYRVRHVMNYTDVDDKLIQRGHELGIAPIALAERYIAEFQQHIVDLNLLPATHYPRATEEIPHIIAMIDELIAKGCAYAAAGDVYFRIEDMQAGARIAVDERKEHPMDFALWKGAKPGEPAWESPWGAGRPGWHIECSVMSRRHLGAQIDIHGGGNDLIFPHHENEIAQTESLTGQRFARYWVHNGMMQLAGEKMSKSLGNLVTIHDFLAEHEADVLRLMVLGSHYRSPLTFSDETVTQAERSLERLRQALRPIRTTGAGAGGTVAGSLERQIEATRRGFSDALDDDFNTAGALGHLFDLVRAIHQAREADVPQELLAGAQGALRELLGLLGLRAERVASDRVEAAPFIELLIGLRRELRQQKLWALADAVRTRLAEQGVLLEDTRDTTTWRWQ